MAPPVLRPATISELTAVAQAEEKGSQTADLKSLLRLAEAHRKAGLALVAGAGKGPTATNRLATSASDVSGQDVGVELERVFVPIARAATLIVERIPAHRDYGRG
ncbi:hypothetical protein C8R43DRAFT_1133159 [Mycena crocata]|nr:hypothetical protein C8R43DRAFT_1133159 [Mycena crocata]